MADINQTAKKIIANVEKAIVGKRQQLILSLVAWLCEGHILLEDVPAESLATSRTPQKTLEGAGKKYRERKQKG